jgi:glutamine cyclotransferase
VTRVIDCSSLVAAVRPRAAHQVLNGIAYNENYDTFFVTGKNWDTLF